MLILFVVSTTSLFSLSWVSLGGEYQHAGFSKTIGYDLSVRTLDSAGFNATMFDYSRSEALGYITRFSFLFPYKQSFNDVEADFSSPRFKGNFSLMFAPAFYIPLGSLGLAYFGVGSNTTFITLQHGSEAREEYLIGVVAELGIMTAFTPYGFLHLGAIGDYSFALYVSSTNYYGWKNDDVYGGFSIRPYIGWGIWVD